MKTEICEYCGNHFHLFGIATHRKFCKGGYEVRPIKDRFEEKIFYSPDGCWYWTGSVFLDPPRGRIKVNAKFVTAYRVAFELYKGPIVNDLLVCHTCDNSLCVNPNHLYLGTDKDNSTDKALRSTATKGENNCRHKLTNLDVISIRSSDDGNRTLASRFGVTSQTILDIRKRKRWKHI